MLTPHKSHPCELLLLLPECLAKVTGCFVVLQVMYFSSLFPYFVLICFLVRALLLEGSMVGIRHMFTPKVSAPLHTLHEADQLFDAQRANTTLHRALFLLAVPSRHSWSLFSCFWSSARKKTDVRADIFAKLRIKRRQSCQCNCFWANFRQSLIDKNSFGSKKSLACVRPMQPQSCY